MNKRMGILSLVVLLLIAFAQPVFAADTALEKYDKYFETGVIQTISDAFPGDNSMSRAEFARVTALIMGLLRNRTRARAFRRRSLRMWMRPTGIQPTSGPSRMPS
jgi:hypothetical protein